MIRLPKDMLFQILLTVPVTDMLNMCTANQEIASMCHDDRIWEQKALQSGFYGAKQPNQTWRQYYMNLTGVKKISLYTRDYDIKPIFVT